MRRRWVIGVALAGTALLAASGCASNPAEPEADASHSPTNHESSELATSSPTASPSDPASPLSAAEATALSGDAYRVVDTFPANQNGESVALLAIDERGSTLLSRSEIGDGLELTPATLVIRDSSGNETKFGAEHQTEQPHQVLTGALSDLYAVWMETPSTEISVQPWTLNSYNRATGQVQKLSEAPLIRGNQPPPPPGFTGPILLEDRVFWAQVGGRPGGSERVDIVGCKISDCQPRVVLAGAAFPAATEDSVYAIATDRYKGRKPGSSMTVREFSVRSGDVHDVVSVDLTPQQTPNGLAASNQGQLWIVQDTGGRTFATLRDAQTGGETTILADSGGGFGYPVMTNRYAAWAESSGMSAVGNYLVDLESTTLFSVGHTGPLYGLKGAGDTVAWRDEKAADAGQGGIVTIVGQLR